MDRFYEYLDRILAMVLSRRFQIFVAGLALLLLRTQLGLSEETAANIRNVLIAYILSESIRPSTPPDKPDTPGGGLIPRR